jgi:hypothetical protein
MKELLNNLFEKKTDLTYVFAEYHPIEIKNAANADSYTVHLLQAENQADEMSIDNIYQSL